MKKITTQWLNSIGACKEGIEWVESLNTDDPIKIIKRAIKSKDVDLLNYCNWGIAKLLNRKNRIRYAVYAAEMALPTWEARHPDDDRPQKAIEAAKKLIKRDSKKNREDAHTAALDAYTAACAASYAAYSAACSAAKAASAAAYSAAYAARAAYAAAHDAAHDADYASEEYTKTLIKCLKYGIKLLEAK